MIEETNREEYKIEDLMRQYGNAVLRTAYAYVKDRDAAEDLFQEVFIKAYYNMDKFRGDCSIKSWLVRITINVCKDYLKSAYQQKVVPMMEFEEDAIVSDDDFEEVETADRNEMIRRTVETLPDTYREVVVSVYFNEMSVAETAAALGIAEGTVKSRLSRARDMLKNKLEGRI